MTPTTDAERQAKFSDAQREWLREHFGILSPRTLITALMKIEDEKFIESLRRMVEQKAETK